MLALAAFAVAVAAAGGDDEGDPSELAGAPSAVPTVEPTSQTPDNTEGPPESEPSSGSSASAPVSTTALPLAPGGLYDVTFTVGSYFNPIPSNPTPPPVMDSPLEFVGACDGIGPCSLVLSEDNFFLPIAVFDFIKASDIVLAPSGGGSYSGTLVGPHDDFCPMPTTVAFDVTFTPTSIIGAFSQVPETRDIYFYDNGNQCWASTFDLALSGARPS